MAKTIDILGVPHVYELTPHTGSSDVLVFVHGWLLSREYWRPVIKRLSAQYSCLSYDLRGFGGSQPQRDRAASDLTSTPPAARSGGALAVAEPTVALNRSPYRPAAYAQDLATLLQKLEISNAWLVGHSLGGSIALWAADQCSDRVKGVICINSGGGIYLKEEFERFRAAGQQLVKMRPRWLCHVPLVDMLMTRMNVATPLERRWGRQRVQDLVCANPEAALGTLLDSTTEAEVHSLPQVIARLQQPVYFIAGANDTIMEPQYVRHLASFHHSFQPCGNNVSEIADCGHMSMVEQPGAVADQIKTMVMRYR